MQQPILPSRRALMLAAALTAATLAGCAKKAPDTLPPSPIGADGTGAGADTGAVDPLAGQPGGPGSQEDFLRSVPADRVLFALDEWSLDGADRAILDVQAQWLARYPGVTVVLEGHADERGTRDYNLALGERRANAARAYLLSRGIAAERIQTISYGKERPQALGSDEASWAQNRRAVTVTVRR